MHSNSTPSKLRPVALDGGYGWFVVLGSFLIHVFTDGFVYSFGIIRIKLKENFNITTVEGDVIPALLTGLMLASGPLASFFCSRIGCRATTIIGAIIASLGCAATYFAKSLIYLILSLGVTMGIGFGFMYCSAIIIVTLYFERLRSLATGITVCGAGVGTFTFAKIIGYLLGKFDLEIAFLIYSGIILLCIPCGLLYRPVEMVPVTATFESQTKKNNSPTQKIYESEQHGIIFGDKLQPVLSDNIFITTAEPVIGTRDTDNETQEDDARKSLRGQDTLPSSDSFAVADCEPDVTANVSDKFTSLRKAFDFVDMSLLRDYLYLLFVISNFTGSIGFNVPPLYMPKYFKEKFNETTTNSTSNFASNSTESTDDSTTIFAYGIANTVGRVVFGLLCDIKFPCKWGRDCARNRLFFYISSLASCGVVTALTFLLQSENAFISYCFFYGFMISSYVCLWSVILVDLVGVERLMHAFGMILLVQGIATFIGPPIAGLFVDLTGKHDSAFVFCGISLLLSGVIMLPAVFLLKHRQKSPMNTSNSNKGLL